MTADDQQSKLTIPLMGSGTSKKTYNYSRV